MKTIQSHVIWAFSFAILLFTSCGTNRQLTSNRKPADINKLTILKPLTNIQLIERGNSGSYSQYDSDKVRDNILDLLNQHLPQHVQKTNIKMDTVDNLLFQKEMYDLAAVVEHNQQIKDLVLSDKMLSLLGKYDQDYVMGVVSFGFTRVKGNYGKQIAKGMVVGILSLGLYTPIPIKSSSTLICFIVDRKNKNIAFYRKNTGQDKDPTDIKVLEKQINGMLNQYFNAAK